MEMKEVVCNIMNNEFFVYNNIIDIYFFDIIFFLNLGSGS